MNDKKKKCWECGFLIDRWYDIRWNPLHGACINIEAPYKNPLRSPEDECILTEEDYITCFKKDKEL